MKELTNEELKQLAADRRDMIRSLRQIVNNIKDRKRK